MHKYQREIEDREKQKTKLDEEIKLFRLRSQIETKAENGGILTSEEINLLPQADRQKFLMKSIKPFTKYMSCISLTCL